MDGSDPRFEKIVESLGPKAADKLQSTAPRSWWVYPHVREGRLRYLKQNALD